MTQPSTPGGELFSEGVAAAKRGDRVKAREVFTRLLRTDKSNEEAWLWMSSVVETDRERIYCLNTALKLNPDSKVALRGLALLGALPAELRPAPDTEIIPDGAGALPAAPRRKRRRRLRLRRSRRLEMAFIMLVAVLIGILGLLWVGNRVAENIRLARITPSPTNTPTSTLTATPTLTLTPTQVVRTATAVATSTDVAAALAAIAGLERPPTATPVPPILDNFYPQGDSELRAGIRLYETGDFEMALQTLERAVDVNPAMVEVYYYKGLIYLEQENYLFAAEQFNRAIDVRPGFAPALVGRGLANYGLGFDPLRHYADAIAADPTWIEAYIQQAIYYNVVDRPDDAMAALEAGLEIAPDHVVLLWRRGEQLLRAGQPEDGLEQVNAALARDPTALEAYLARGNILLALERHADAQEDLNLYTSYAPDDPAGWAALAQAFIGFGDLSAARDHLTTALALAPKDIELLLTRGELSLQLEDYEAAEGDFLAVEDMANSAAARIGLGQVRMAAEDYASARSEFERAASLEPQSFEPIYWWGVADIEVGNPALAINRLAQALDLAISDVERAKARYQRARAYAANEQDIEAIADLRVVLIFHLPPDQAQLQSDAAALLDGLGGPLPGPTHTPTATPGA